MIFINNNVQKQKDFKNEKELQTFFETNLQKILGLKFIETEFAVGNFRIDTLAFDDETNSFRIIEYKNIKNNSLVDQGFTYLKLLLERKADFVLKYNHVTKKSLNLGDIDWDQSKIIFVSPVFSNYQLNASDFKNMPFDLIKVTKYEDDIVDIDFIKKNSSTKIEEISFDDTTKNEVFNSIKVYTEDDHLENIPEETKSLYENLKIRILDIGDIDIDVRKKWIAFKGSTNIVDIVMTKKTVNIFINMKIGTLIDPEGKTRNVSNVGHWGNGDYEYHVNTLDDIEYAISFINQSYKINKK